LVVPPIVVLPDHVQVVYFGIGIIRLMGEVLLPLESAYLIP